MLEKVDGKQELCRLREEESIRWERQDLFAGFGKGDEMKLSIYKNPRTDHTYQVNRKGDRYMIVERDWMGDVFQVMAFYNRLENAQDVLDRLSDSMDWRFCGEQKEVGFVD